MAIDVYEKGKDLNERGMQKEENDLLIAAVEAAREYAQRLADINRTILLDVPEITIRIYDHPRQIGAPTITYCCDRCQCFPLSDRTWYVCIGLSKSVSREGSIWFCGS